MGDGRLSRDDDCAVHLDAPALAFVLISTGEIVLQRLPEAFHFGDISWYSQQGRLRLEGSCKYG